jgi:hypothetical protein
VGSRPVSAEVGANRHPHRCGWLARNSITGNVSRWIFLILKMRLRAALPQFGVLLHPGLLTFPVMENRPRFGACFRASIGMKTSLSDRSKIVRVQTNLI